MSYIVSFLAFTLFSFTATAQIVGVNSKPIDENRYEDIKGSPYLFDDWQEATIYNKAGKSIEEAQVNYNIYEKEIEVKVAQGYIELDGNAYPKILMLKDSSYFQYNAHPKFKGQFVLIHFKGEQHQLFSSSKSRINTRTINNVGQNIELENFANVHTYYLLKDDKLYSFKLKKKDVLDLFPDKSVNQFVKQERLKLSKVEEVVQLLRFVER
ncbi:MAG: hypothetical protein AAF849_00225 [Bacteroidota bacterium]